MEKISVAISNKGAVLTGYIHDRSTEMPHRHNRPAIIICPGGGYSFVSERESDPVALSFLAQGYQAFILRYSVEEQARELQPLIELSTAMMLLRENNEQWNIDPDKIAVCGFSAGGHLAGSLGVLWNHEQLQLKLDTKGGLNKPNALILAYPVITSGEYAHRGSFYNLTGYDYDEENNRFYSLEKRVSEQTPPTFIWHTGEDDLVPIENSLLFIAALRRAGIPFEAHLYEKGHHGLSMCNEEVGERMSHCGTWFQLAVHWLNEQFQFSA
ncbi:alpha/beta hydrolase [Paenibacillus oenotherae]|uniref:Alpha/beta hydrolase n=1 Tax=Paenibacillus oenotherae TaxID=1435645 RepID=A0ABS7DDJ1_9BACL|nr:alpha/beta hydrolase [Paenibacillus oenotherae]MBW7477567.1 alpha/beta hydrolase [Paenibacillus oenotherae]